MSAETPASALDPDLHLVPGIRVGDGRALGELMRRHGPTLRGWLSTFNGRLFGPADAEEIANDAFVRVARSISNFRGECAVKTWIFCIARRLAINRVEFNRRRFQDRTMSINAPLAEWENLTLENLLPDDGENGPDVEREELERELWRAFERLDGKHREILHLRLVEDRDYAAIAASLGISVGTVKSRIARARQKLRAFVAEREAA